MLKFVTLLDRICIVMGGGTYTFEIHVWCLFMEPSREPGRISSNLIHKSLIFIFCVVRILGILIHSVSVIETIA